MNKCFATATATVLALASLMLASCDDTEEDRGIENPVTAVTTTTTTEKATTTTEKATTTTEKATTTTEKATTTTEKATTTTEKATTTTEKATTTTTSTTTGYVVQIDGPESFKKDTWARPYLMDLVGGNFAKGKVIANTSPENLEKYVGYYFMPSQDWYEYYSWTGENVGSPWPCQLLTLEMAKCHMSEYEYMGYDAYGVEYIAYRPLRDGDPESMPIGWCVPWDTPSVVESSMMDFEVHMYDVDWWLVME